MSNTHKKTSIKSVFIAAIISILIGVMLMYIGSHTLNHSFKRYILNAGYSLFIGMGLFSNGLIFNLIEPRYISWIKHPGKSIIIAISAHIIFSSVIIFGVSWIYFTKLLNTPEGQFWNYYKYTLISVFVVTVFITSIIYLKSFFKSYRDEAIQGEQLKQEAIILQYQIMQNQVNPHFLFNALNILSSLIDIDIDKAKKFTFELSLFYRELLNFKDKDIVPIAEELNFVKKYIFLQKIRFGENFEVDILIKDDIDGELIPMSLQMMVENAVKHNIIAKNKPLRIVIGKLEGDEIFIENNHQPKEEVNSSNKIGLKNLQKRYLFLTNKEMSVSSNDKYFRVTIPLIKVES